MLGLLGNVTAISVSVRTLHTAENANAAVLELAPKIGEAQKQAPSGGISAAPHQKSGRSVWIVD
jgi:biopolymer transport protein ExbB/TolQ